MVHAEYGCYLVVDSASEADPPSGVAPPDEVTLSGWDGGLRVGCFTDDGPIHLTWGLNGDGDAGVLDLQAWDIMVETTVTSRGPLRVVAWDFSPATFETGQ